MQKHYFGLTRNTVKACFITTGMWKWFFIYLQNDLEYKCPIAPQTLKPASVKHQLWSSSMPSGL